jgi:thiamine kinase-like enzyme
MKFTDSDILEIFQQIQGFSSLDIVVQRVFSGTNFVSIVSAGDFQTSPKKAIFREFGSCELIDAERERMIFELASNSSVGPKMLLETQEYRIEEFLEGKTMERTTCINYLKSTAAALAEFHSLIDCRSSENSILAYLHNWRSKLNKNLSSSSTLKKISLLHEIDSNFDEVATWQWPSSENVLSHNDFSYGNLIVQDEKVRIIDFEYSGPGHPSTDLASFLIETMFDFSQSDYRFFPQDELPLQDQKSLVFHYCQLRNLDGEDMWLKVKKSKAIVCFLGALWAGCNFSEEKPSMIDYAFIRLELFNRFKNELS